MPCEILMTSLRIVNFDPVLVTQKVSVDIVSHVWISVFAYFTADLLFVNFAIPLLNNTIIPSKRLSSCFGLQKRYVECKH